MRFLNRLLSQWAHVHVLEHINRCDHNAWSLVLLTWALRGFFCIDLSLRFVFVSELRLLSVIANSVAGKLKTVQITAHWTVYSNWMNHEWYKQCQCGVCTVHDDVMDDSAGRDSVWCHWARFMHHGDVRLSRAFCLIIVHSKKTEPWQPQLVGWYERGPLHDPNNYGVRVLIKEEDDDVWRHNYRPVMVLDVVPSRCRLNIAVCGRSNYFLVTEHFQASCLLFFRVG